MNDHAAAVLQWLEIGNSGTRTEIARAIDLDACCVWRALQYLVSRGLVKVQAPEVFGCGANLYSAATVPGVRRQANPSIVERALAARTALELAWA